MLGFSDATNKKSNLAALEKIIICKVPYSLSGIQFGKQY
jgi:hypothetical protein